MKVLGKNYRTIWAEPAHASAADAAGSARSLIVKMIDQPLLPHRFEIATMRSYTDTARAIREMTIRGAPAIGAAGAYGMAQAFAEAPEGDGEEGFIERAHQELRATRPTAYDLFYNLDRVLKVAREGAPGDRAEAALAEAERLANESVERCRRIGEVGADLIAEGAHILTHCNAGWLATVDWGTALAPMYHAHQAGRKFLVLADETRPRLQGANLTAWELGEEGIDCEVLADNAAGLLMRRGEVQLVITGADRIAANGDVANKIGTYEKAVLAREHGIPFYVAAPVSTFDPDCASGEGIPIEERPADEVLYATGLTDGGEIARVRLAPEGARARNPAFDITPANLVEGFITEFGIIEPTAEAIEAASASAEAV